MQEHEILLSKLKMEFQISEEAHQRILQSFEKGTAQPKRWAHALHAACMGGQSVGRRLPLQLPLRQPTASPACVCMASQLWQHLTVCPQPGLLQKSFARLDSTASVSGAAACSARASATAAQFEADYVPPAPKSRSGTKARPKSAAPGASFGGAAGGGSKAKGGSKASKKRKAR